MKRVQCSRCPELQQQVEEREKKIRDLEAKVAVLEYDLKEMRQKWFGRKKKKQEPVESEAPPKKRGAPLGHKGWFRKTPDRIDETEDVLLEKCPNCGSTDLTKCKEIDEHIQEDIVLPQVKVTRYRRQVYWCGGCKEEVMGRGKEEIPYSHIGPQAKSLAAFLKYKIKMSQRDMTELFKRFCRLTFVPSSVPGFHNQVRKRGQELYDKLKERLKEAPYIHADETGARLDGEPYWDWVFASTKICLHAIQKGRGQDEVEAILGENYNGILISDFLTAYDKIKTPAKQRCLVHLLRDLKKALECSKEGEAVHTYCQRLKTVIQQAIELSEQRQAKKISKREFDRKKKFLQDCLQDFHFPNPNHDVIRRLSKRLKGHQNQLLTFLDHPGLPYHNNFAERLIRPSVILRKIIFGCRSQNGVANHNVLMSLLQTAQLNGRQVIPMFQKLLTSNRQSLTWCLGP
jgi:hypothetical protein